MYVSDQEAYAYKMAGDAPEENVQGQIFTVLLTGGMDSESADFLSAKLAEHAVTARAKVRAAREFELVVEPKETPKPSSKAKAKNT